ncbi:MAG: hypothetical protein E7053_08445 [Lentisphaerae bacterium]|nr:hypothetical protein [Lentisphaerota bacterium]
MKKFSAILIAVFCCVALHAADPAFHGTLLDAMEEVNPRTRIIKLIDAIEISTNSGPTDANAMRMLTIEMDNNNPAIAEFLPRLTGLLDKNPGDLALASFCFNAAVKYNKLTPELFAIFEKSITLTDISNLSDTELNHIIDIFRSYANSLICDEQYDRVTALIDAMTAKKTGNIKLIQLEAELIVRICFMIHNTAPGINGFDELDANDPWKTRLKNIGDKLLKLEISSAAEAETLLNTANLLRLAQTPELLRQYASRFSAHDWALISATTAANNRQPDLFIPGDNAFLNLVAAIHAKNFTQAEAIIAAMPENLRQSMTVILDSARGNHQQVTQLFSSGQADIRNIPLFSLLAVINSAFIQKDTTLIRNILSLVHQAKQADAIDDDFLCNSIGYVAAVFNIDLDKAESLIRFALESDPQNSSYLDSMAWVLFRQGKNDEAEEMISQAIKHREPSAAMCVLYLHAAEIKVAQRKFNEAKILLNKAKALYDPDDEACSEYNLQTEKRLERLLK